MSTNYKEFLSLGRCGGCIALHRPPQGKDVCSSWQRPQTRANTQVWLTQNHSLYRHTLYSSIYKTLPTHIRLNSKGYSNIKVPRISLCIQGRWLEYQWECYTDSWVNKIPMEPRTNFQAAQRDHWEVAEAHAWESVYNQKGLSAGCLLRYRETHMPARNPHRPRLTALQTAPTGKQWTSQGSLTFKPIQPLLLSIEHAQFTADRAF